MIGKPEWFTRRKYTGWGFSPKTWQGWVYILAMVSIMILVNYIPVPGITYKLALFTIIGIVFVIDFAQIMTHLPKDEREKIHEAIAERNALWAILLTLVIGVGYETAKTIVTTGEPKVDPVIIIAVIVGTIVKLISNLYLDRKD